jgi:inosose dehydratase
MPGRPSLAGSPVSWGVDFPDNPANPVFTAVLDGVRAAGLTALELGPYGYFPRDASLLADLLAERELSVVGTFLVAPLHDPASLDDTLERAAVLSDVIAAVDGDVLVVIDEVSAERTRTAGDASSARRLDDHEWSGFISTVERVAAVATDRGITPVFHPHAGSYVEFEDEIDRLAHSVRRDTVALCLDSGHCAYAGMDPIEIFRRYASLLRHVHLKDVDSSVRERALRERLGFWEASAASIFCRLGEGAVDFSTLAVVLREAHAVRWATVEQDREPAVAGHDPLGDLRRSIDHLTAIGYATSPLQAR